MSEKIESIEITFKLTDGRTHQASIFEDAGWQQWGAITEQLGATVDTIEAMAQAAADAGLLASDHDDDDDDDDGPEYGQTATLADHDRPVYLSDDYGPVDDMDGI